MRGTGWWLATAVVLLALAGGLLAARARLLDIGTEPPPAADRPAVAADSLPPVGFGVVSRYNPRRIYEGYQPIMDYLTAAVGRRFVLRLSDGYEETVRQLVDGEIAFASLGNYTYIRAHRRWGVRCVVVPLNERGEPFFHSMVVVREDAPLHDLAALRGRSFAFTSRASMSYWMARHLLREAGVTLADLGPTAHFRHHETVAEMVLRGEYTAGAVKDLVARQYAGQGLRVLAVSPPIPAVPVCVRADADSALTAAVRTALLALDPDRPGDAALLADWDPEFAHGFVPARDADYAPMRRILARFPDAEVGP